MVAHSWCFKALSRMSSFPTLARAKRLVAEMSFKALSRMSSFPTIGRKALIRAYVEFQSAVAHELISNDRWVTAWANSWSSFKALSRMSSFPTPGV